jgi:hypothetical protein
MKSDRLANLPKTALLVDNVLFQLCGDFAALIEAEAFFNNLRGRDVNLAAAIWTARDHPSLLNAIRQILPCALHTFHPELRFEAVQAMIDRLMLRGYATFMDAIERMWPPMTQEMEDANQNLCFDLDQLAEANEFFGGETRLTSLCVRGPVTLEHVYRTFPCAVHQFRPELSLADARRLMTLPSVFLVFRGLDQVRRAPATQQERFIARLFVAASEEERQDTIFRIIAAKQATGVAQA